MRKSLLVSLALLMGAFLGLVTLGARATPVNVNLQACTITSSDWCNSGSSMYTNSGITFQGWENTSGSGGLNQTSGWAPADLTYKNGSLIGESGETGLGVLCTYNSGDKCDQHEINTVPPQYISAEIGGLKLNGLSLTIGVQSVDSGGGDNTPETALIYGATCAQITSSCSSPVLLQSHTGSNANNTWTFNFTAAQLSGFSFLYITPLGGSAPDANILLGSFSYSVPEPAVLGMFGLGILFMGVLVGLRRHKQQH